MSGVSGHIVEELKEGHELFNDGSDEINVSLSEWIVERVVPWKIENEVSDDVDDVFNLIVDRRVR